jgi:phosphoglycerate kinase
MSRSPLAASLPRLEDLPDLAGRRVLLRADFNVPLRDGSAGIEVADDYRIRSTLPTIEWLLQRGADVTACTHLGRPKGRDPRLSVEPVKASLARLAPDVKLLENLRYSEGETRNDPTFVKELTDGFDAYVNDAFGASHRAHASIVGPPGLLLSAAGRVLYREVEVLGGLLESPARPFVAVVGGAKVAGKLGVLRSLLDHVDLLVVGGGMAYTFLAAQGRAVGESLLDETRLEECARLLESAGDRILLPTDVLAADIAGPGASPDLEPTVYAWDIPAGTEARDIGPETARRFADAVAHASTVLWNGPLGVFEDERFAKGTRSMAEAVASSEAFTVVGGGDSVAAIDSMGFAGRIGFVSTGGGAMLELLEFGDLPGLEALRHASHGAEVAGAKDR